MSVAAVRQPPYPVRVQQRRCGKCGKLVSRSAYACRRCGKAQRMRPKTLLLLLSGVLMAGMFAVAILTGSGATARAIDTPPVAVSPGAPAARVVKGQTPEVSAADLWSAYSRDRLGTDRLYRDRSVLVNGTVRSVERNFEGDIVVRLTTPDPLETVNATLATRTDPAINALTKGRAVSLLCVGRGALMGAPLLNSCFVR
jgi:ribosomal protein L40E